MNSRGMAFTILIIFSIFGMIMLGNIVHELSHKQDFEKVVIGGSDKICALIIPKSLNDVFLGATAGYSFNYNKSVREEAKKIKSFTEYKAYLFDTIITLLFIFCFYVEFKSRNEKGGNK